MTKDIALCEEMSFEVVQVEPGTPAAVRLIAAEDILASSTRELGDLPSIGDYHAAYESVRFHEDLIEFDRM